MQEKQDEIDLWVSGRPTEYCKKNGGNTAGQIRACGVEIYGRSS